MNFCCFFNYWTKNKNQFKAIKKLWQFVYTYSTWSCHFIGGPLNCQWEKPLDIWMEIFVFIFAAMCLSLFSSCWWFFFETSSKLKEGVEDLYRKSSRIRTIFLSRCSIEFFIELLCGVQLLETVVEFVQINWTWKVLLLTQIFSSTIITMEMLYAVHKKPTNSNNLLLESWVDKTTNLWIQVHQVIDLFPLYSFLLLYRSMCIPLKIFEQQSKANAVHCIHAKYHCLYNGHGHHWIWW